MHRKDRRRLFHLIWIFIIWKNVLEISDVTMLKSKLIEEVVQPRAVGLPKKLTIQVDQGAGCNKKAQAFSHGQKSARLPLVGSGRRFG